MNTLKAYLTENIYGNLGIGLDAEQKFIEDVPVMLDQYGTKYDRALVLRNPNDCTITFQNTYNKDNRARNIVFDFGDYIDKLSKLDLKRTVLTFKTAIPDTKLWPEKPTWHFRDEKLDSPKMVILTIETRCLPPILDPDYDHIVKKNYNTRGVLVFKAARYLDDYDPKHIHTTEEFMKSWTIIKNDLK